MLCLIQAFSLQALCVRAAFQGFRPKNNINHKKVALLL